MAKKETSLHLSIKLGPYPLDLVGTSLYEIESRVAEAILTAREKRKKQPKTIKAKANRRSAD